MGFTGLDVRSWLSASFSHSKRSDFVHDHAVSMFMYTHSRSKGDQKLQFFHTYITNISTHKEKGPSDIGHSCRMNHCSLAAILPYAEVLVGRH